MSFVTYLGLGMATMLVKFAFALVAAHRNPGAKERLKKTWTAWAFLFGIPCWPLEAAHMFYVLLRSFLSTMLEAA